MTLFGWVAIIRDHGQLLFVHLRERTGVVQLVFNPDNAACYACAKQLRSEYVIGIVGDIKRRNPSTINPSMLTGAVEVHVTHCDVLNASQVPPFAIDGEPVDEELRLKYRYLDIRGESMQQRLASRSAINRSIRQFLDGHDFLEIETPILTKSTPEGARDYIVPSRQHVNHVYALPQSPQLFKQLLMVGGIERYYQIARCFRDEDLRANRQAEFSQLDIEMSFVDESAIMSLASRLLIAVMKHLNVTITYPFPTLSYTDAINRFGTDAPDLRVDLEIVTVTSLFQSAHYHVFRTIADRGGLIGGIRIDQASHRLGKSVLQGQWAKQQVPQWGGKGMTWMKVVDHDVQSNITQFLSTDEKAQLIEKMGAKNGDVLVFIADSNHALARDILGRLRIHIAQHLGWIDSRAIKPCWIVDFPLFSRDHSHQLRSWHHPFTQPKTPFNWKDADACQVSARAYDLVINGEEIGGGSMRIHDPDMQVAMFRLLGLDNQTIESQFGFFIQALRHGAPPHGGMAIGIDRLTALMTGASSIREVIAFPKNRMASCPLTGAPSCVQDTITG